MRAVPTLSKWGMLGMSLAMLAGVLFLRRRTYVASPLPAAVAVAVLDEQLRHAQAG